VTGDPDSISRQPEGSVERHYSRPIPWLIRLAVVSGRLVGASA